MPWVRSNQAGPSARPTDTARASTGREGRGARAGEGHAAIFAALRPIMARNVVHCTDGHASYERIAKCECSYPNGTTTGMPGTHPNCLDGK